MVANYGGHLVLLAERCSHGDFQRPMLPSWGFARSSQRVHSCGSTFESKQDPFSVLGVACRSDGWHRYAFVLASKLFLSTASTCYVFFSTQQITWNLSRLFFLSTASPSYVSYAPQQITLETCHLLFLANIPMLCFCNTANTWSLSVTFLVFPDGQVEAGTPFGRWFSPGEAPLPEDETCADMYRTASRVLGRAGYDHYEVGGTQ